jgi:leucyl aminopeptidase
MYAIARLGLSGISVTGLVAATENMAGGSAMRPGDVLTALNGETIEVLNTDAEGRLVLADVLSYAKQEGATHIVDFATLTGGAMVALGSAASLLTGKPDEWRTQVQSAAQQGMERVWPMPIFPEYRQAMDSDVADIKNTGGRYASALTAAAFLTDFTQDVSWAHLDIAGTSFAAEKTAYQPKGGTGVGVATIVHLVMQLSADKTEG